MYPLVTVLPPPCTPPPTHKGLDLEQGGALQRRLPLQGLSASLTPSPWGDQSFTDGESQWRISGPHSVVLSFCSQFQILTLSSSVPCAGSRRRIKQTQLIRAAQTESQLWVGTASKGLAAGRAGGGLASGALVHETEAAPPTCPSAAGRGLCTWLVWSRHGVSVSFLLFLPFTPKAETLHFNTFPSFLFSSTPRVGNVAADTCCPLDSRLQGRPQRFPSSELSHTHGAPPTHARASLWDQQNRAHDGMPFLRLGYEKTLWLPYWLFLSLSPPNPPPRPLPLGKPAAMS